MAIAVVALALGQVAFATQAEAADADRFAVPADDLVTSATTDAADDETLTVDVYLAGRERAELEKFVKAVSDPRSEGYGKYLSVQEFRRRYAATDKDLAGVADWLAGSGLRVTTVPANRRYVRATGRAAAAERAFGVDLRKSAEHGRVPATAVTVPGALRSVVAGVSGLAERRTLTRAFHGDGRAVPDISMVADPATGMVIGYTQTFPDGVRYNESRSGGTSLASPLFAGMMALADQQAHLHHGFVNPVLYRYANRGDLQDVADTTTRAQVRSDYVNRIDDTAGVTYSLRSMQFPQTIATGRGYDDMTGVGSPRTAYFLAPDPDPGKATARRPALGDRPVVGEAY
jgi:subtilase family serine protease